MFELKVVQAAGQLSEFLGADLFETFCVEVNQDLSCSCQSGDLSGQLGESLSIDSGDSCLGGQVLR